MIGTKAFNDAARRGIPRPLRDEIERRELTHTLAERWEHRLLLVDAPGGFGKSTALARAVRDNLADPSGTDVFITCRRSDADIQQLAHAICLEIGAAPPVAGGDSEALANRVAAATLGRTPDHVCIILDDVSAVRETDELDDFLDHLVSALPSNGHLLISGRDLARLADSIGPRIDARVGADQLRFTDAEVAALADQHDGDAAALADLEGWPALSRLALSVGRSATRDFLMEEVVESISPADRIGLAATVIGRRIDDATMAVIPGASGVDTSGLRSRVPLIIDVGDGVVAAHDLWHEAADKLVDPATRHDIGTALCNAHRDAARPELALEIAVELRDWDAGRRAVLTALRANDSILDALTGERWLHLFPTEERAAPELLLLRGLTARMESGALAGLELVEQALEVFSERGDAEGLAVAVVEKGLRAGLAGRPDMNLALAPYVEQLVEAGHPDGEALATYGKSMMRGVHGDLAGSHELGCSVDIDKVLRPLAPLLLRARSTTAFVLGEGDEGVAWAEQLVRRLPNRESDMILAHAHWQNGSPDALLTFRESPLHGRASMRDGFLWAAHRAVIEASLGRSGELSSRIELPSDRVIEHGYAALIQIAEAIVDGDERAAADHLATLVDTHGLVPVSMHFQRFVAYGYLLHEGMRERFDSSDLGPLFETTRAVARVLHRARIGGAVDWDSVPEPAATLCFLPLRWSIELAARGAAANPDRAAEMVGYLATISPAETDALLTELAGGSDDATASGAATLLRALPAIPRHPVRLTLCGEPTIAYAELAPEPATRTRVAQLVSLLALNEGASRSLATTWLWPESSASSGTNNLRVALAQLRDLLEPDRDRHRPSFFVREHDGRITLFASPELRIEFLSLRPRCRRATACAAPTPNAPHRCSPRSTRCGRARHSGRCEPSTPRKQPWPTGIAA